MFSAVWREETDCRLENYGKSKRKTTWRELGCLKYNI